MQTEGFNIGTSQWIFSSKPLLHTLKFLHKSILQLQRNIYLHKDLN